VVVWASQHGPPPRAVVALWGAGRPTLPRRRACLEAYLDLLRIGAWAPVIFGAVLVVTGLIRCWAAQARR